MKMKIIIEIPTIENPRIDVSHVFWWYNPSSPPAPPQGRPCGGWGYPKMKMKTIFEIPTIENPRIDVSHVFWWYNPSSPPAPPPKGALAGVGGTLK